MIALTFTGNVTREPDIKTVQGKTVCNFAVAVEPARKNERAETKYINVGAWGKLGEICGQCVRKGSKVGVTAKDFSFSTWQGKDGQSKAQMQVNADDVEFLSSKAHEEAGKQAREEYEKENQKEDTAQRDFMAGFVEVDSSDLPF